MLCLNCFSRGQTSVKQIIGHQEEGEVAEITRM
jgi:hypothetical protein